MTEPEYFRVNVSTATSPPSYDEATGERKAEVDMLLPSNLINVADKVERAEMAVMKMKVPLALIPSTEIPIDQSVNYSSSSGFVQTTGVIGIYPAYYTALQKIAHYQSENGAYPIKKKCVDVAPEYLKARVKSMLSGGSPNKEKTIGVHSFDSISEFLECLSRGLNQAVFNAIPNTSYTYNGTIYNGLPLNTVFQFLLNSDNTITLRAIMVTDSGDPEDPPSVVESVKGCIIPEGEVQYLRKTSRAYTEGGASKTVFYKEGFETEQKISDDGSFVTKPNHITYLKPKGESHPMRIFIACNRVIRDLLPSLPWIRKIRDPEYDNEMYGDEFFLLDTTQAVVDYHQNYVMSKHLYVNGTSPPESELDAHRSFDHRHCAVDFHFIESDAVSLSQVSSIVLTMNGAAFNQQVYPVNFDQSEMTAAQTTTVPIIDVFYPMCTRPSDWTTDMIVVKSDFTNAGPVTINPIMLKERSIKFKLYYITASGEMREMLIPAGSPFIFQLCFALWVKKIKN